MDFLESFAWVFENGKKQPAAPIKETIARFQAGFSLSVEFHSISKIFVDFHRCVMICGMGV